MSWLKVLLWFDIGQAIVMLLRQAQGLAEIASRISAANSRGLMWLTPQVLMGLIFSLGLPAALIGFSIATMRRRPGGRLGLIIICWIFVGLEGLQLLMGTYYSLQQSWYVSLGRFRLPNLAYTIAETFNNIAIIVLTLLFITRDPIKSLFVMRVEGFEVLSPAPKDLNEASKSI